MGMFDSVYVKCPECKEQVEFQSKAGHCNLDSFNSASDLPAVIAADLEGESRQCQGCGDMVDFPFRVIVVRI